MNGRLHYSQEQRNSVGFAVSFVVEDSFMYCDLFGKQGASSKNASLCVFVVVVFVGFCFVLLLFCSGVCLFVFVV